MFVLLCALGLGYEWFMMCGAPGGGLAQLAVVLSVGAAAFYALRGETAVVAILLLLGTGLAWRLSRSRALGAGVLYLGIPVACLAWLRDSGGLGGRRGASAMGRSDVLFLIVVVWASDIGAYLAGRLVGGPKLAPSISPGKTRSGAVGGLLAAMIVGEGVAHLLAPGAFGRAAAIAGVLGIASQAGDLLESWIKRRFGVKDSGWLIPGHGGLLDRLDGLLAAAPAAACIAVSAGRGGVLWN